MDFSKVDWAHVAVATAAGAILLPAAVPLLGVGGLLTAAGVIPTAALGAAVGGLSSFLGHTTKTSS